MPDRKLPKWLSGYATNTLTEAERRALFEAALDDQALFDALADEQALKELLDAPGSRQRLLEALEETDRAGWKAWLAPLRDWFRRPLGWALAGSLVAAVMAVALVVRMRDSLPPEAYRTTDSRRVPEPRPETAPAPPQEEPPLPERRAGRAGTGPPKEKGFEPPAPTVRLEGPGAKSPAPLAPQEPAPSREPSPPASVLAERPSEPEVALAPEDEVARLPGIQAPAGPPSPMEGARTLFYAQAERSRADIGRPAERQAARELLPDQETPAARPKAARPKAEAKGSGVPARETFGAGAPKESVEGLLGLRYSILQQRADGTFVETDPAEVFDAGATLRLAIEANHPSYLYVLKRDPAAGWTVLFPPAASGTEAGGTGARVVSGTRYVMPLAPPLTTPGRAMRTELFILCSRTPRSDFDRLVASLGQGEGQEMPRATFIDALIDRARREAAGRPLRREKVAGTHPAAAQERAVYVVDTRPDPDSLVFVEVIVVQR
ncbi:MAG: hypothetical protein HYY20_01355 [Candidatus Tectomicrobia bacterium]|uniref:DUF4384 domain-containing protein n=1 Tax=Tectimicrobiota bacterium TaxID=2528274 RepID=A0A932CLB9_UNCTE|nr:hypothetical protein [Candidatus Tectomicrobia bacterium]